MKAKSGFFLLDGATEWASRRGEVRTPCFTILEASSGLFPLRHRSHCRPRESISLPSSSSSSSLPLVSSRFHPLAAPCPPPIRAKTSTSTTVVGLTSVPPSSSSCSCSHAVNAGHHNLASSSPCLVPFLFRHAVTSIAGYPRWEASRRGTGEKLGVCALVRRVTGGAPSAGVCWPASHRMFSSSSTGGHSPPPPPSSKFSFSSFFSSFLFRKVPTVPGFTPPPSTIRWATVTFWNMLHPLLYFHSMHYYPAKVKLDRLLEKQYWGVNLLLGITFGLTLYFSVLHHLLPTTLPDEYYSLKEDAAEVLELMGYHRSSFSPLSSTSTSGGKAGENSGWMLGSSSQRHGGGGVGFGMGGSDELPAFLLMKAKGEVMGRLHLMVDAAEIRRQQEAVAALLEEAKKPSPKPITAPIEKKEKMA